MTNKALIILLAGGIAVSAPPAAWADDPAPTSAPAKTGFTTAGTPLGDLLDDAGAKVIVEKHLPDLVKNPSIAMARALTLKALQSYAGGAITDDKLAAIDYDLAKLPAK